MKHKPQWLVCFFLLQQKTKKLLREASVSIAVWKIARNLFNLFWFWITRELLLSILAKIKWITTDKERDKGQKWITQQPIEICLSILSIFQKFIQILFIWESLTVRTSIQDVAYLTTDSILDSGEYHSFPNLTWKLSFLFNCRFDFITNQLS